MVSKDLAVTPSWALCEQQMRDMRDPILAAIQDRTFSLGIVGLGYVGIPLMCAATRNNFPVLGFDIDRGKISTLNSGKSPLKHIESGAVVAARDSELFEATDEFSRIADVDAVIICVPTPLTRHREPDLSCLEAAIRAIAPHLRRGQLIISESTSYPGTTNELIVPIIKQAGFEIGTDIWLAYSPEREDPGNDNFETSLVPKVVGAHDARALEIACALYDQLVTRTVPVSSTKAAEAVKLTENIFRAVNIGLVNELKVIYQAMGIDIWEVIDAASSKPFGFMPFYPGPGLGGHCIPIDPFYLTWKAREFALPTRFIEVAGEINSMMPNYVVAKLSNALDTVLRRCLSDSSILVLGVAYKRNIGDIRESPALTVMDILRRRGAKLAYHDPYVPTIDADGERGLSTSMQSVQLTPNCLADFDAAVIITDHTAVEYRTVVAHCPLVVDTRNATRGLEDLGIVVRA